MKSSEVCALSFAAVELLPKVVDQVQEFPMSAPIRAAIIDDEEPVCKALAHLMRSTRIEATTFSSPHEFLGNPIHQQVDCAITDIQMPGFDGLQLQEQLSRSMPHLSMVFITGHGDI